MCVCVCVFQMARSILSVSCVLFYLAKSISISVGCVVPVCRVCGSSWRGAYLLVPCVVSVGEQYISICVVCAFAAGVQYISI